MLDLKISVPSPKEFEQDNSGTQAGALGASNQDKSGDVSFNPRLTYLQAN